jgi:hypothetical protein
MREHLLINQPVKLSDLTFEDLYVEISDNWQERAKRLQARRWRHLKNLGMDEKYGYSARGS